MRAEPRNAPQVDMTWSGHVHVYERTCPVLYKTCLGYDANGYPLAPVHLDIGNGGYVRQKPPWPTTPMSPLSCMTAAHCWAMAHPRTIGAGL